MGRRRPLPSPALLLPGSLLHPPSPSPPPPLPQPRSSFLLRPRPSPLRPAASPGGGAQARSRVPLGRSRWPARRGPVPGSPHSVPLALRRLEDEPRGAVAAGWRRPPCPRLTVGRAGLRARIEGQALGSRNVGGWGQSGCPEPVSRLSRCRANLAVSGARWRY